MGSHPRYLDNRFVLLLFAVIEELVKVLKDIVKNIYFTKAE